MENEIWKDIIGYEGYYQVSNLGNVKSLERYRKGNRNSLTFVRERILKRKIDKDGYAVYALCKDNKMYHFTSHKLVALVFIPNPSSYSQINHINGIKLDNSVSNLEWCDNSHNMKEAYRIGLSKARKSKDNILSKKVVKLKNGLAIQQYDCIVDASKEHGLGKTAISNCLNGRSKTCAGFEWKYL